MIADAPAAAAANTYGGVLVKLHAFVDSARSAASGGLTWAEFGELLVAFLRLAVSAYDEVSGMTGEEKKLAVMQGVADLFDAIADRAVPLAAWPVWILVRPAVRSLVLALAAGAIEQLLPLVRFAR